MTDIQQNVTDNSDTRKWFTILENMADDDLNPYQYRLLGHYKRVCGANGGKCTESVRETAQTCKMSVGMVSKTRKELRDLGWINFTTERHKSDNGKWVIDGITVTIKDRWAENFARFSNGSSNEQGCSPHEQDQGKTCSPHEQGCSPHETKKNQKTKEQKNSIAPTPSGGAEALKPPRKRSAKQLALDAMKNALADAFGLDHDTVTSSKWDEFGTSGKQLIAAGATPDDMKPLHAWCVRQGWKSQFTSMAMAKNYPNYVKEKITHSDRQTTTTHSASTRDVLLGEGKRIA